jgi:hypothetical protein
MAGVGEGQGQNQRLVQEQGTGEVWCRSRGTGKFGAGAGEWGSLVQEQRTAGAGQCLVQEQENDRGRAGAEQWQ